MALMLHVDFDGDDWVGLAAAGDQPNQLGITSDIRALRMSAGGAGATLTDDTAFDRYDIERAKYGKGQLLFDTGTTNVVQATIGYDGVNFDTGGLTGQYTAVLWAKVTSGNPAGNTFFLSLFAGASTLVASSAAVTLSSSAWTKFTVTGTSGFATRHLRFTRSVGTTDLQIALTGAMIVPGANAPTWFNCGSASLLEDITSYWMDGFWHLGWTRSYQHVAALGKAELTLKNADKRFSPEYSSGPLYGGLIPNLLVQIADPDLGIWWTGWTDRWKPEPGTSRNKRATLSATDARRFLDQRPPVELYSVELPSVILADIGLNYNVPNTTSGLSTASDGTLGWYAVAGEVPLVASYGEGIDYDWDGVKVYSDLMKGAQGHTWFTRIGSVRSALQQGDDTPASYTTLSDTVWMEADYADEKVVNHCEAIAYMRRNQSSFPSYSYVLWEAEDDIVLAAGESDATRVFFTHDTDNSLPIGASNLNVTGTLSSGVFGTAVTAVLSDVGATSALLTLTNTTGGSITVTSTTVSASNRMTIKRKVSKEYEDTSSVTANGSLSELIDSLLTQSREWAKKLARYTVNRFSSPQKVVPWVKLHADKNPSQAFACNIGAPVRVTDTQTAHDRYYGVIGEHHTVKAGLKDHTVRVYLEPLYPTTVDDTAI